MHLEERSEPPMNQLIGHAQAHAGAVGTCVTGLAAFVGWTAAAVPVLQVVSLLVAIIAGSLTIAWYWKQLFAKK